MFFPSTAAQSLLVEAGGFPEGKFRRNGEKLYVFPIHGQLNSPEILFGKSVWLVPKVSWWKQAVSPKESFGEMEKNCMFFPSTVS
jgi:hypothetical protein